MKPTYADMQFFILHDSTDSFAAMQDKLEKAFNCTFDDMTEADGSMTDVLGLRIGLEDFDTPDGIRVYTLFGRLAPKLVYSETSPHRDIDACEWFPAVGLDYFFITILQCAGCGIWRLATPQDEQNMQQYARE